MVDETKPSHHVRVPLLLMIALAAVGCRDATKPSYTPPYSLTAYTNTVNPAVRDSIVCLVNATWESTEPITAPWTGFARVSAQRFRWGDTSTSVLRGTALVTILDGPGDSVRVTLSGAVSLTLDGRARHDIEQMLGSWTCDDSTSIGGTARGETRGVWFLNRDYPID
jgi:hypothetical protein